MQYFNYYIDSLYSLIFIQKNNKLEIFLNHLFKATRINMDLEVIQVFTKSYTDTLAYMKEMDIIIKMALQKKINLFEISIELSIFGKLVQDFIKSIDELNIILSKENIFLSLEKKSIETFNYLYYLKNDLIETEILRNDCIVILLIQQILDENFILKEKTLDIILKETKKDLIIRFKKEILLFLHKIPDEMNRELFDFWKFILESHNEIFFHLDLIGNQIIDDFNTIV